MVTTIRSQRFLLSFFIVLTLIGLHSRSLSGQSQTIVFSVSGSGNEASMDAIVVIDGKQLRALDLDGDGMGEVFAQQGGFDGYTWLIFKNVNGRWRQVYEIAGDAC